MKFRKMLSIITAFALLFCLQACSNGGDKLVKNNLQELIFSENGLVPGEDLLWNMGRDDFLNTRYVTDALRKDSEQFDESRVGEMSNGMTDYTVETEIKLKDYGAAMDMIVLFDENDELIRTTYRTHFSEAEQGSFLALLNAMAGELDGWDSLSAEEPDLRNFTEESMQSIPFFLTWHCEENGTTAQLQAMKFRDTLLLDLAVYVGE